MIAQQEPMTDQEKQNSDELYRSRWRTLLSVDDLVESVVSAVEQAGALSNTYFLFTSDHGWTCATPAQSNQCKVFGLDNFVCQKENGIRMNGTLEFRWSSRGLASRPTARLTSLPGRFETLE